MTTKLKKPKPSYLKPNRNKDQDDQITDQLLLSITGTKCVKT